MCLWENNSQTKALSCRHSCPAHREIYLDIALSLHFDSQQSFSREFKSYSAALPVNTATVIIGISQNLPFFFNTSTAKDGV